MPFSKISCLLLLLSFYSLPLGSQIKTTAQLEDAVTKQNDALDYEKSIRIITDFIADPDRTPYEKYNAYIFKSYTYKRVFNYAETLYNLDLALREGLKSDKKAEVRHRIKAEKAFVYFDTHDYRQASKLMQELHNSNYKYLDADSKAWIIMQEGCLSMMQKDYAAAERKLDTCLSLVLRNMPRNAPNVYGKKVELYNAMKLYGKRDQAFRAGLQYARKYKILKYEMYLYEVMAKQHQINQDFKSALASQQKYDSLQLLYNSANHDAKIQILENRIDDAQKESERKDEGKTKCFLIGLISILLLLLLISGRLYIISKQKSKLVENENSRIHKEIEKLSKAIDEKGNKRLDLSTYNLTERQKEIIGLIRENKSNKEIAALLFISENTVKYHLKIIYEILDVAGRVGIR